MEKEHEYTFSLACMATVSAESEEEAREILESSALDEDVTIGSAGIYLPIDNLRSATLEEVYKDGGISEYKTAGKYSHNICVLQTFQKQAGDGTGTSIRRDSALEREFSHIAQCYEALLEFAPDDWSEDNPFNEPSN